jgi:hypothetical protein
LLPPGKTIQGGIRMLAPLKRSILESELLPDVRLLATWHPGLVDYPARLAKYLEAEEQAVRTCQEALYMEDLLCQ